MKLWYHESCRVFQDRLVNDEDRSWFDNLMKSKMKSEFNIEFDDVVKQQPLIFGDFMSQGGDQKPYVEITDHEKVFVGRKKVHIQDCCGVMFLPKNMYQYEYLDDWNC